MHPSVLTHDFKALLTETIRKQVLIFGPSAIIPLVEKIPGLTMQDDGTVLAISGDPENISRVLLQGIMELNPFIAQHSFPDLFPSLQENIVQDSFGEPKEQPFSDSDLSQPYDTVTVP